MKNIFLIFLILVSVLGVSRATTFTVSNTNDTGAGSLRQALLSANDDGSATAGSPHQINFSVPNGSTITVVSPFLVITNHVSINGLGVTNLTISGGGTSRIFWIQNGTITIQNLTLANGYAKGGDGSGGGMGAGGAIFMHEGKEGGTGSINLKLVNVNLTNNSALGGSGGSFPNGGGGGMGGNALGFGGGGVLGNGDSAGGSVTDASGDTPGTNGGLSIFGSGGRKTGSFTASPGSFGGGGGSNIVSSGDGGFGGGGGGVSTFVGNGGFGGGGSFSNNSPSKGGFGAGGGQPLGIGGFGGGNGFNNIGGGGMGAGGAIFVTSGRLDLTGVSFNNNTATRGNNGAKGYGGALFIFNKADNGGNAAPGTTNDPSVSMCNVTFSGNTADDDNSTYTNNDNVYASNTASLSPTGYLSSNATTSCVGGSIQLSFMIASGTGPFDIVVNGVTYNNVPSGSVFATLTEGVDFTGATNFNLTQITDANNCVISGLPQTIAVSVNTVDAGSIGGTQTVCSGGDPQAFSSVTAGTGTGTITYRWEQSTSSCNGAFTPIPNSNSATYNPPANPAQTTYYRRITISTLNGVACEAISNCVIVTLENDLTPPVITCPAAQTVTLGANCSATLPNYTSLAIVSDNCGIKSVTQSPAPGTFVSGLGNTTVTITATDNNNNTAACSFVVTGVDNTLPSITCPATQTLSLGANCSALLPDYTSLAVRSDNCGIKSVTQFPTGGTSVSGIGSLTITITATDNNDNVKTCTFIVNKLDITPPSITCPAMQTLALGANCLAILPNYTSLAVALDNCGIKSVTQSPVAGTTVSGLGNTTVTITATDDSGNPSTCAFTVTRVDNTPPSITCPANITVNNITGQCGAVVTYTAPVGTDNCSGVTTTQIEGLASGSTFPVGVTTNRFRVTDGSNLTAECSFTVTVVDVEPPKIVCPANITVNNTTGQCGAVVTYEAPVGTDNCTGVTTTQIAGLASGATFPVGVTTNTFRVTDGANQTAECSFTVMVVDVEPPKITCPVNITVNNTPGQCGAVVTYTSPVGTDNCTGVTTIQIAGLASGATFPVGVTTNRFRVTDGVNLTAECSFTVTVVDAEAPKITCPANITVNTTTGQCGAVVTYTAPVGTDNCSGVTTTQIAGLASGSTFPVGVTTNTFRVTDGVNLTAECSFTVTVVDAEPPKIVCPANITVNTTTGQCGAVVTYTAPIGTDNCMGVTTTQIAGLASGSTFPVGVTRNTFRVTDGANQTAECSFTVTVVDVEPPKITCPANITVNNTPGQCGAVVTYTPPVGTDNCTGVTTTQIAGLASGATFPLGVTTNTFRVTDGANLTAECSFTVTVVDVEPPKITCPANITVNSTTGQCGAVVTYTAPIGTDNCSGVTTTQIAGLASGSVFPVGVTMNTFRVTDGTNLTAECSFTVTVVDVEPPTIVCPGNIVVFEGTRVTYLAPVGTDNCSGAITSQTSGLGTGVVYPVGVTTNTFKVTASNGQTSECSFTVTVISKPTITLSTLQQTLTEGTSQEFCDTDANPVNSLQFTVTTGCVINDPVWRVQVGNGAWSDWSINPPVSQLSNNQPHRYQAACSASNPVTYTSPIEVKINYRASTPQQVALVADGVTVKEGESKEVCNIEGNALVFNATCGAGEVLLYSVDGGDYSSVVPTQLVDGQFHNYRVRCRKSDGTPSCIESESGVMRLKITNGLGQVPVASLNVTSGCGTPVSFSGTASCGSLTTVWYNASTNVALPTLPSQTPAETTSYYARCQAGGGCLSEKSNVVTYTVIPVGLAPVVSVSSEVVCAGTTVTISANCPVGSQTSWNTGVTTPSFEVSFNNVTKQTYWAKCIFSGGCQSAESVKKDVYWNAFVVTMINVGESKSGVKVNDRNAWSNQFITRDGGPELAQSTQVNPTLYYVENVNKVAPRYWTINVDACALGTGGSLTFDLLATPETGVPQSFNTHENNAPYFMYANREGWTELYAQNHPAYGFYQDNGVGGNAYDAGLPKGLYKLGVRYWDQKGWGSIYPSTRKPQGNVLAYQEYWFRIQSKDGVGVGAARTADSGQQVAIVPSSRVRGLFVHPNPVTNILRLQVSDSKGQDVQATLVDASGRKILHRKFVPETNTHQEEFGVSELPTGMYFLKVSSMEKQATLKVVKVH